MSRRRAWNMVLPLAILAASCAVPRASAAAPGEELVFAGPPAKPLRVLTRTRTRAGVNLQLATASGGAHAPDSFLLADGRGANVGPGEWGPLVEAPPRVWATLARKDESSTHGSDGQVLLFASEDGGRSWTRLSKWRITGASGGWRIADVRLDDRGAGLVLVDAALPTRTEALVTGSWRFETQDGGRTWKRLPLRRDAAAAAVFTGEEWTVGGARVRFSDAARTSDCDGQDATVIVTLADRSRNRFDPDWPCTSWEASGVSGNRVWGLLSTGCCETTYGAIYRVYSSTDGGRRWVLGAEARAPGDGSGKAFGARFTLEADGRQGRLVIGRDDWSHDDIADYAERWELRTQDGGFHFSRPQAVSR